MKAKVIYSKKAFKDLKRLNRQIAQKIIKKIKSYTESNNPLKYAKKLNPPFDDLYRFKIGDYRVIFETDSKGKIFLLTILKIGHRKNIY